MRLDGVAREQGDAALPGAVRHVARDADVPVLAPQRAPRVLDCPEVGRVGGAGRLGAVADDEHAVVELLAAALREHAAAVQLEGALVGLHRDGDGLLRDGRQQLGRLAGRDCTQRGGEAGSADIVGVRANLVCSGVCGAATSACTAASVCGRGTVRQRVGRHDGGPIAVSIDDDTAFEQIASDSFLV